MAEHAVKAAFGDEIRLLKAASNTPLAAFRSSIVDAFSPSVQLPSSFLLKHVDSSGDFIGVEKDQDLETIFSLAQPSSAVLFHIFPVGGGYEPLQTFVQQPAPSLDYGTLRILLKPLGSQVMYQMVIDDRMADLHALCKKIFLASNSSKAQKRKSNLSLNFSSMPSTRPASFMETSGASNSSNEKLISPRTVQKLRESKAKDKVREKEVRSEKEKEKKEEKVEEKKETKEERDYKAKLVKNLTRGDLAASTDNTVTAGATHGTFGMHLERVMDLERAVNPSLTIPQWVKDASEYIVRVGLDTEGIFRLSASRTVLLDLKTQINSGKTPDFSALNDVVAVCNLLAAFVRELPAPLVPEPLYDALVQIAGSSDDTILRFLQANLPKLPPDNKNLLAHLLWLFYQVSNNHRVNKMTAENMARVMGPNIMWKACSREADNLLTGAMELENTAKITKVGSLMITLHDRLFDYELNESHLTEETEEHYENMIATLMEPQGTLLRLLSKSVDSSKLEALARCLIDLFPTRSHLLSVLELFIKEEVCQCQSPAALFKSQIGLSGALVLNFNRMVGQQYLEKLISPLVTNLSFSRESLEVQADRVKDKTELEANRQRLASYMTMLLDGLNRSFEFMPLEMRAVFHILMRETDKRFPEAKMSVCASLFFQKFVCPAITGWYKKQSAPDPTLRQSLVWISKLLQGMALGGVSKKEDSMAFFSTYADKNFPTISRFMKKLGDLPANYRIIPFPPTRNPSVNISACAQLHALIHNALAQLCQAAASLSDKASDCVSALSKQLSMMPPPPTEQQLRDSRQPVLRRKFIAHPKSASCIVPSSDREHMYSADKDGNICRWSCQELELDAEFSVNEKLVFSMLSVDGHLWVAASTSLTVWNEHTLAQEHRLTTLPCFSLVLFRGEVWAACGDAVRRYNVAAALLHEQPTEGKTFLCCTDVDDVVWMGSSERSIVVFTPDGTKSASIDDAHTGKVNCLTVVRATVWSASDDTTICVWDKTTLERLRLINAHEGRIYSMSLFGNHLWSCSWDCTIRIWNTGNFSLAAQVAGYTQDAVSCVVPHRNPATHMWYAWSTSVDRSVCVWWVPYCSAVIAKRRATVSRKGSMNKSGSTGSMVDTIQVSKYKVEADNIDAAKQRISNYIAPPPRHAPTLPKPNEPAPAFVSVRPTPRGDRDSFNPMLMGTRGSCNFLSESAGSSDNIRQGFLAGGFKAARPTGSPMAGSAGSVSRHKKRLSVMGVRHSDDVGQDIQKTPDS